MTRFGHLTQFSYIPILAPRYHDNMVLIACHKVGDKNKVKFLNSPSMGTDPYFVSGSVVKKCKKTSNGSIAVYEVPLDKLSPLELVRDFREFA